MPSLPRASDLTAHLGFWLRTVSNQVSQAFADKLAAKDVTIAEWTMMRALYGKDPMSPSRLADEIGAIPPTITKLANRLITKSLVVRRTERHDRHPQTLALTPQGTSLVPELAALADRNDADFFHHLTEDERQTLERLLKRMVARWQMIAMPIR